MMTSLNPKDEKEVLYKLAVQIRNEYEDLIRKEVKTRTGELVNSIYINFLEDGVEIGNTSRHAAYLEYGTSPHMVKPKTKKALKWKDEVTQKDIFDKGHIVSGIKPYAFLLRAVKKFM